MSQEKIFLEQEANAWFRRNTSASIAPAPPENRVLQSLSSVPVLTSGVLLDVGGATGRIAEGFRQYHSGWRCKVVEPSLEAIAVGQSAFPHVEFRAGSICQIEGMPWQDVDIVIVSGVFCWVDRHLLSRAICNVDSALKNGGLLVISDFDSPSMRANPYKHHLGIHTYKQDYSQIFTNLGTYHVLFRKSENLEGHTGSDESDSYDRQWVTSVLKKDISGRYFMKQDQ